MSINREQYRTRAQRAKYSSKPQWPKKVKVCDQELKGQYFADQAKELRKKFKSFLSYGIGYIKPTAPREHITDKEFRMFLRNIELPERDGRIPVIIVFDDEEEIRTRLNQKEVERGIRNFDSVYAVYSAEDLRLL